MSEGSIGGESPIFGHTTSGIKRRGTSHHRGRLSTFQRAPPSYRDSVAKFQDSALQKIEHSLVSGNFVGTAGTIPGNTRRLSNPSVMAALVSLGGWELEWDGVGGVLYSYRTHSMGAAGLDLLNLLSLLRNTTQQLHTNDATPRARRRLHSVGTR